MKLTEAFLSAELIRALGWTILHSLWQGALVALALSGLLLFLNRYSAQVRYFVSVTALFTLLALSGFTFFSLYNPLPPVSMAVTEQTAGTFSAPDLSVLAPESPAGWSAALPFTHFFSEYFEKHLPLLVTFWFLGLLVMALKMLGGLVYVQRLRHYQTRPLPQKWQQKLAELGAELNLQKPVLLLESLKVNVPMALGYLKPVILVPVGALNGLSEKQVEAILAHELAHICRHDYLFNLLQSFIETIFFFHPAVWWMNACIRAERENCCDDIAMNLCGDPVVFAGALAELEERNFAAGPAMAVALTGRKGSLLSRIKRLADRPKRRAGFSEGFMAACIVMISLSAISLSAMAQLRP
ncbi:MAG TPA: M56 family metallopeptidase, partial [Adhaeribacter sp.]|nr:M56 family metallopeptidase [Adhaeribacter sp.]